MSSGNLIKVEECQCSCHKGLWVYHSRPCCEPCYYCGKRIKGGSTMHAHYCLENPKNKGKVILDYVIE
jgi:hypothetical protein